MRRIFFIFHFSFFICAASAQVGTPSVNAIEDEGRAPYRTEFISYDIRGEAEKEAAGGGREGSKYFRPLTFKLDTSQQLYKLFKTTVEIPALWLERDVYIRDTGRTGRYRIVVNGEEMGLNTDSYGTNDYYLTPYLVAGVNTILLVFTDDMEGGEMERFTPDERRNVIENLYIYSQPRIHVFDYILSGHHDDEFRDTVIDLAVILVNSYNMPETVTVGYDIYDPAGKLKEYAFREVTIPGRGCDTVRFYNKVTGTEKFQYSDSNPALYRGMLSLEHGGRKTEYIPFRLGFGLTSFDGEVIRRGGKTVAIVAVEQDAPVESNTLKRLKSLKRRGGDTLYLMHPQQKWFYDMCETEGLYIIDRAAVECDPRGGSRGLDGTVANDPAFLARFLDRQQAMYYRNRNRVNVIGWSLGGESGNGYNMYKSYQLMKELDPARAVVYGFAEGEWNTDMALPASEPLSKVLEGVGSR